MDFVTLQYQSEQIEAARMEGLNTIASPFQNFSLDIWNIYNATNSSSASVGPSPMALRIGAVVMLVALLWGLFANALTMYAILTNRELKNITNMFIVSLCINDIMNLGLSNLLVLVSYFMMTWSTGLIVCEILTHFTVLLMGSSLWHTGLIAIHRLIVVCFNSFYKKISKRSYTIFVLTTARIVPILFLIQPHLGNMVHYEPKLLRCIIRQGFGLYTMLVSIVLMIMPSLMLIICYIAIFIKVHRSASAFRATRKREWLRREIQITKMFGFVFLVIILGYLPYGIVRSIDKKLLFSADFYVAITVLYAVANSCNPIIYGSMDMNIRRACFRALNLDKKCMGEEQRLRKSSSVNANGHKSEIPSDEVTEAVPLNSNSPK